MLRMKKILENFDDLDISLHELYEMETEKPLVKGVCKRIGSKFGHLRYEPTNAERLERDVDLPDHDAAVRMVIETMTSEDHGVISDVNEISAVGHRIVHGGDKFSHAEELTPDVISEIDECSALAPIHNPVNLMGIYACQKYLPEVTMVGVFDTAFHHTLPEEAYLYGIPYEYYKKYKIRRYGFHGISHNYVSNRLQELHPEYKKVIICHLGNGSSITAIKDGKVIDTSMGLTPLDGFIMGSRCGAIDPSVVTYLQEKDDLTAKQTTNMMNKQAGFLGVSGVSSDMRDVEIAAEEGNERAQLALDIFYYQVPKLIASYIVALQGLDALVFTAGIGENGCNVREGICRELEFMGIKMDYEKNDGVRGKEVRLDAEDSNTAIFMIPTNEELMIARETKAIIEK